MSRPEVTRIGLRNGQGKLFTENAYLKNKHAIARKINFKDIV
jgi:hypothetical protein